MYLLIVLGCLGAPRVKEPREQHNNTDDSSSEQVKVPHQDDRRGLQRMSPLALVC